MGTTRYTTINGRIISQNKNGVYTRLLSDPLGNVIATVDASGVKTNDTTYWPYGEVRTGGVSALTNLGFCGAWGYYTDASTRLYVRARYYRPVLGRWQSVDPLWPEEGAFVYVGSKPLALTDPSGLKPKPDCYCQPKPRAVNVPCPKCLLFKPPDAGFPIGLRPPTRQRCYDQACEVYCVMDEAIETGRVNACDNDNAAICNDFIKKTPPCSREDWKDPYIRHFLEYYCGGVGGNLSCGHPQPITGAHCCNECNLRYYCSIRKKFHERDNLLQESFRFCNKYYNRMP